MKHIVRSISFLLILFPVVALAQGVRQPSWAGDTQSQSDFSSFQSYVQVELPEIQTPTVVSVPLTAIGYGMGQFNQVVVSDETTTRLEPFTDIYQNEKQKTPFTTQVVTPHAISPTATNVLFDGEMLTFADFPISPEGEKTESTIIITTAFPVSLSSISLSLPRGVKAPDTLLVSAVTPGGPRVLVARSPFPGTNILFPSFSSHSWELTFEHSQPFRVSEITLGEDYPRMVQTRALRFLAQPGHVYRVYGEPDTYVNLPYDSARGLSNGSALSVIQPLIKIPNPLYVVADGDGDKVPNLSDNCPNISNSDQVDLDNNRVGDACDDFDRDGTMNPKDNCPNLMNFDQRDTDGDGIGDVCDSQESRFTEEHPWVPWVGIGTAFLVLAALFILTARVKPILSDGNTPQSGT